jgi:hypothetical protein
MTLHWMEYLKRDKISALKKKRTHAKKHKDDDDDDDGDNE